MEEKSPQANAETLELSLEQKHEELKKAKEKVSKAIVEIVHISATRHTAKSKDSDLKYLNKLETQYMTREDLINLEKAREIIITPEYILVAGYKLDRFDVEVPKNPKEGIYNKEGHTFFNYEAAVKQSAIIGRQAPSLDQWRDIFNAIPGNSAKDKFNNMLKILNLTLICPDGDFPKELEGFYHAQAPEDDEKNLSDINAGHYIILREPKLHLFNDGCSRFVTIRTVKN